MSKQDFEKARDEWADKMALRYYQDMADKEGLDFARHRSGFQIQLSDHKETANWAYSYAQKEIDELNGQWQKRWDQTLESLEALDQEIYELKAQADNLSAVIQHALELGHMGEGSTKGWADKALKDWQAFKEKIK